MAIVSLTCCSLFVFCEYAYHVLVQIFMTAILYTSVNNHIVFVLQALKANKIENIHCYHETI